MVKERSRREFAIGFFRQLRERMATTAPAPLGLHILMGSATPQKLANMTTMLDRGIISPTEMVCRAG